MNGKKLKKKLAVIPKSNKPFFKRQKNNKIEKENKKLLERIKSAKSKFSVNKWIPRIKEQDKLLFSLSQNGRKNPYTQNKLNKISL